MIKQLIANTNFSDAYQIENSNYFKDITTTDLDYWNVHEQIFSTIDKDAAILDVGVWFGIVPWALNFLGYKDVDCTECRAHSMSKTNFPQLHKYFGISPFELHIKPKVKFELPKKYDVITFTKSNVHWKTEQVVHYDGIDVKTQWQVQGIDKRQHTFFSMYEVSDWEYFIENCLQYLNEDGRVLLNIEPLYNNIEYYLDTHAFLFPYLKGDYLEIKK
jgi:hypothetical protein